MADAIHSDPAGPSSFRAGKRAYRSLPAGTELHRIHPSLYGPDQFNGKDRGNARFSPIRDAAGGLIPTFYGGQSFNCAVCDVILRCPDAPPHDPKTGLPTFQIVFPSDFADHSHSVLKTTGALTLVDVTTAGQRRIGLDQNVLLAGPRRTYPATRAWAEMIHAHCPKAQGLHYSSFQYGPEFTLVLFGDRTPAGVLAPQATRPVPDPACHRQISSLARSLSIDYAEI